MLLQLGDLTDEEKSRIKGFNTASGKCCCNCQENQNSWAELLSVSIPQAVSAVATSICMFIISLNIIFKVSIPQAVSAVATYGQDTLNYRFLVSIPQAVSAVATITKRTNNCGFFWFQYRKR